jgi:hypothetical protein
MEFLLVPDGFDKNLFIEARNGFEYAPDIFTTGFGDAALPGVA